MLQWIFKASPMENWVDESIDGINKQLTYSPMEAQLIFPEHKIAILQAGVALMIQNVGIDQVQGYVMQTAEDETRVFEVGGMFKL